MRRALLLTVFFLFAAASARAADVITLATLAVTAALDSLADDFRRTTGHVVRISYDTGPNLARRAAAGEVGHVLIAPTTVIEQGVMQGRVAAEPVVPIGRVGVGVAVRRGARVPVVATPNALRQALLDAEAVFFSQGTSGAHVSSLFTTLGVADQIRDKTTQLPNGGVVMERVIADTRQTIGFTMLSEIQLMVPKGATLAGPLPPTLQNYTPYAAAVLSSSPDAVVARQFVSFLAAPAAQGRFRSTGWERSR